MTILSNPATSNPFRQALQSGRSLVGVWAVLNSSAVIEGLCWSGFDWIMIDNEHAPTDLNDTLSHLRATGGTPTIPMVRPPWNDAVLIKQYLDIGVQTLMLPHVQSAEEAAAAVSATRYPPFGERGVALMHRASRYGRTPEYLKSAANDLFVIVQIESEKALGNLGEIIAVEGIDAIFFGPGDLSANMGYLSQPDHPDVLVKIDDARKKVQSLGKFAGVLATSPETAARHIESGFNFVSVATDGGLLFAAADKTASTHRRTSKKSLVSA